MPGSGVCQRGGQPERKQRNWDVQYNCNEDRMTPGGHGVPGSEVRQRVGNLKGRASEEAAELGYAAKQ